MIGYIILAFIIGGMFGYLGCAILAAGARADKAQEKLYKRDIERRRDGGEMVR